MKKIIAIAMSVLLVMALFAGCAASGNDAGNTGNGAGNGAGNEAGNAPAVQTVIPGQLTVALAPDFAPMEFVDTDGNFAGFDVFLAQYIADELDLTLVIMPMSFDACQTAVEMGTVDMSISGFSWTEERAEYYNLSNYYHAGDNEDEQVLITLSGNEGMYDSAEELNGVKVGAQVASLQESLVKEQLPDSELVTVSDLGVALEQMRNGDCAVLAVAKGNGEAIIANNDDIIFAGFNFEVDEKYTGNVILMQKGNDQLTTVVNDLLAQSEAAGLWVTWYAEAESTAGIDVSYDDEGNKIE